MVGRRYLVAEDAFLVPSRAVAEGVPAYRGVPCGTAFERFPADRGAASIGFSSRIFQMALPTTVNLWFLITKVSRDRTLTNTLMPLLGQVRASTFISRRRQ